MERKLTELGKLLVDDSLRDLEESKRVQREIELQYERKSKRLIRFAWILALTFVVLFIIAILWMFLN